MFRGHSYRGLRVFVFGVVGWILFGLVAGVIAKLIMSGRDPGGFIITILARDRRRVSGRVFGTGPGPVRGGEAAGMIMSILGPMLLLGTYRMMTRSRTRG